MFIETNNKTKTNQFKTKYLKKYLNQRKYYEKKKFLNYVKENYNKKKEFLIKEGYANSESFKFELSKIKFDLIISFGCSIIKSSIIDIYKNKFINIHLGLSPYMKGAGTNFFPFVLNKLELLGSTIMLMSHKLDDGKIIHHTIPSLNKDDNIHTIGFNLIKKTFSELINILKSNKKLHGKRIYSKKFLLYKRKDFDEVALKKAEINLQNGIIEKYLLNQKKLKLIKFYD